MEIGENIKKYRNKIGLTQKELAIKVGVTPVTIQNYENNRREPNIETLNKIAEALDTNVYNLIDNNTTLTSKLIKLFEETICKNCDATNTLELISESIDIDEEVINKAMENEEDISESYLVCMIDQIFEYSPGAFEEFYKRNKHFIFSKYVIVHNKCSELELKYAEYISFLSRLNVSNRSNKHISDLFEKALHNTLNYEDMKDINRYMQEELDNNYNSNLSEENLKNVYRKIGAKINKNKIEFPQVSLEEIKNTIDKISPLFDAEIKFLRNKNLEKIFNYSFNELAKHGYENLLIVAIENAIKQTLTDIKIHLKNEDIFDGIGSWISKDSPAYNVVKNYLEKEPQKNESKDTPQHE